LNFRGLINVQMTIHSMNLNAIGQQGLKFAGQRLRRL
jgi:hypothetical protein